MSATWAPKELALFRRLDTPTKVQAYLHSVAYDPVPGTDSPRVVIREGRANCFEGALLAAASLRQLGYPPLLVDMTARNDDDHVLAVFRQNGAWGCVAKSNFTVLRFREPVYRTVRELIMSFFDVFYNSVGEKTLRTYSAPFDVSRFDKDDWMTTEKDLEFIGDALNRARHYRVMTRAQVRDLQIVDPDLVKAGLLGANPAGLFKPKKSKT